MKLKTFIEGLNELIDKEPGALDLEIYAASDDEGNEHNPIHFSPSLSLLQDGEMIDLEEGEEFPHADMVIIIN